MRAVRNLPGWRMQTWCLTVLRARPTSATPMSWSHRIIHFRPKMSPIRRSQSLTKTKISWKSKDQMATRSWSFSLTIDNSKFSMRSSSSKSKKQKRRVQETTISAVPPPWSTKLKALLIATKSKKELLWWILNETNFHRRRLCRIFSRLYAYSALCTHQKARRQRNTCSRKAEPRPTLETGEWYKRHQTICNRLSRGLSQSTSLRNR